MNKIILENEGCKRIAIVGNGGIATEMVHELSDCELLWIVKDKSISANFFDAAAGKFLLNTLSNVSHDDKGADKINVQRHHYNIDGKSYITERKICDQKSVLTGGALGPDWALNMKMKGCGEKSVEVKFDWIEYFMAKRVNYRHPSLFYIRIFNNLFIF